LSRDDGEKPGPPPVEFKWTFQVDPASQAHVDLTGVDPALLAVLRSPRISVDRWRSFFAVYVEGDSPSDTKDVPPLWGSYRTSGL
jgi:hypothetical protein